MGIHSTTTSVLGGTIMEAFGIIDYLILSILIYHAFLGLRKGFVRLILDMVAVVGSLALGYRHYQSAEVVLNAYIPSLQAPYSTGISFVAIWIIVFFALLALNKFFDTLISASGLGIINRSAGLVLGTVKGMIILIPILLPMLLINNQILDNSQLAKPSKPYLDAIYKTYIQPLTSNKQAVQELAN